MNGRKIATLIGAAILVRAAWNWLGASEEIALDQVRRSEPSKEPDWESDEERIRLDRLAPKYGIRRRHGESNVHLENRLHNIIEDRAADRRRP